MKSKLKIGLIFGGQSGEHEVSLQSAKSIFDALDKNKYEVILLGIDKQGAWHLGNDSSLILNSQNPKLIKLNQSSPQVSVTSINQEASLIATSNNQTYGKIDVFFPITHGTYGEDGSLQGLLELFNLPYVGSGVLGSAVGMDKVIMKRLLRDADLPVAPFFALKKHLLTQSNLKLAIDMLGFPMFVKPANLGSSVGVTKAKDDSQLQNAIDYAFQYDHKIILETAINCRELEVSVLGNDQPQASLPGEVTPTHEFYSYEAKYIDENGAHIKIPADLPSSLTKQLQDLAVKAFMTLECSGMARVDFFLEKDTNQIFINEINTLPGFTKISMYPKLWEASGISYSALLDQLINLALDRHRQKQQLIRDFSL